MITKTTRRYFKRRIVNDDGIFAVFRDDDDDEIILSVSFIRSDDGDFPNPNSDVDVDTDNIDSGHSVLSNEHDDDCCKMEAEHDKHKSSQQWGVSVTSSSSANEEATDEEEG